MSATRIPIFNEDTLPFAPSLSEKTQRLHSEHNSQWLLLMILAQLVGVSAAAKGAARTVSGATITADATIAAGKRSIALVLSDDFSGTVAGVAITGPVDDGWSVTAPDGDTLGAVAVTVAAGTIRAWYVT